MWVRALHRSVRQDQPSWTTVHQQRQFLELTGVIIVKNRLGDESLSGILEGAIMFPVFLIGGGWAPDGIEQTYGTFVRRATLHGHCKIAVILATEDEGAKSEIESRYRAVFETCGLPPDALTLLWGTPLASIPLEALVSCDPTGVFVGGGLTPLYQTLLCTDLTWVDYLRTKHIPYAGFSAGAAIAAHNALVGGWQVQRDNHVIGVLDAEFGENLTTVETRSGLGLVPFTVDVHASQWGTITRLMQAVELGLAGEGWAIDENTVLCVEADYLEVRGLGHAYHVQRLAADTFTVRLYRAGGQASVQRVEIGQWNV
jgi:cyanophycinase